MSLLHGLWLGMIVHLWQTTLVLALIFVIDRALRGAPSRVSNALWSIGLAKIVLPLSLFGGISSVIYRAVRGPMDGDATAIRILQPVITVLYPVGRDWNRATGSTVSLLLVVATVFWAACAAYSLSRIVKDAIGTAGHVGRGLESLDEKASRWLGGILDGARIPRGCVLLSRAFAMPAVVGFWRPRIVLPDRYVRELPTEELRAIIVHEDTHRRRRDPLRALLRRLTAAVFFFYPLIYPVVRRLEATAEFACDERVIHSGVPSAAYSRALARALEFGLATPSFAAAAAGGSLLRRRLRRFSTFDPRRYPMRFRYRIMIMAAAAAVIAASLYPLPMRAGDPAKGSSAASSPEKTDTAGVFHPFDTPPKLLTHAQAAYPEKAKKLGVEALILLEVVVGDKGEVRGARVLNDDEGKEHGTLEATPKTGLEGEALKTMDKRQREELLSLFEKSSIDAVMTWVFDPATLNGKPVIAKVAVPFRFKLH
jgi:hypothetical protein